MASNKKPKITFGADPEFFIFELSEQKPKAKDKKQAYMDAVLKYKAIPEMEKPSKNVLVPAWVLGFKGEKGKPEPLPGFENVGTLVDGVALELNIKEMSSLQVIRNTLVDALSYINETILTPKKTTFKWHEFIEVPEKYRDHISFKTVGCDPDIDAYNVTDGMLLSGQRPAKSSEELGSVRYAGGHIHIGCDPWPIEMPKEIFVRFLDIIYFATMYRSDRGSTPYSPRFPIYGKPGLFRDKPYGIEYRSPTSTWIKSGAAGQSIEEGVKKILINTGNDKLMGELLRFYELGYLGGINTLDAKTFETNLRGAYDNLYEILFNGGSAECPELDSEELDRLPQIDLPEDMVEEGAVAAGDGLQRNGLAPRMDRINIPRPRPPQFDVANMEARVQAWADEPIEPRGGPPAAVGLKNRYIVAAANKLRRLRQEGDNREFWFIAGNGRVSLQDEDFIRVEVQGVGGGPWAFWDSFPPEHRYFNGPDGMRQAVIDDLEEETERERVARQRYFTEAFNGLNERMRQQRRAGLPVDDVVYSAGRWIVGAGFVQHRREEFDGDITDYLEYIEIVDLTEIKIDSIVVEFT